MIGNVRGKKERGIVKKTDRRFWGRAIGGALLSPARRVTHND